MLSETKITMKHTVPNRELTVLGEDTVMALVQATFANVVRDFVQTRMEITTRMVEIVPVVDYTLPSFQFSQQFGREYTATLVIMSTSQLKRYEQELCQTCTMDALAEEAFSELEYSNC